MLLPSKLFEVRGRNVSVAFYVGGKLTSQVVEQACFGATLLGWKEHGSVSPNGHDARRELSETCLPYADMRGGYQLPTLEASCR